MKDETSRHVPLLPFVLSALPKHVVSAERGAVMASAAAMRSPNNKRNHQQASKTKKGNECCMFQTKLSSLQAPSTLNRVTIILLFSVATREPLAGPGHG